MYRELQLLERYVVASGKMTRGMLKAYVIGAGAIYGEAEESLHTWFKSAWHNAKHLPIYGDGKNLMPTIYIQNLARIVQQVMDRTPKNQRYIIAVDPVLCIQEEIVKAISKVLGTGNVKNVPEKDIYLNRELTAFQADQILLDLPIESAFCQDNFSVDWTAENGMKSIMQLIVEEYRKARGLIPIKIIISGPPGIGKSTVARQLADIYHFHHFDDETMVDTTVELLKEIAASVDIKPEEGKEEEEEEETGEADEEDDYKSRQADLAKLLLNEVDECLRLNQKISEEVLAKLYRYRLKTNPIKNQGYVLDGYPHNANDAKTLFSLGERYGEDEEMGEDDRDILDPQILPGHVVFLEAPDEFILDRLAKVPIEQLLERHHEDIFPKVLADYHAQEEDYDRTFVAYLNEQEILYDPIDVSTDLSEMLQKTVTKISHLLGKPRNYGLSAEEEASIRNAQRCERAEMDRRMREDMDLIKTRLLEARRKNIEQWMEQLEKAKRDEFEREEAAMIPLRHYLMAHVVPTLTKGLIDITRLRPEDPIDYLAEFLFQNNPGGVNPCGESVLP
jgi:adenylate kinase